MSEPDPPAPAHQHAPGAATGAGRMFHPAGWCGRAWMLLAVTVALALTADLSSKWAAFRFITDQPVVVRRTDVIAAGPGGLQSLVPRHLPLTLVPHVLDLQLVLNAGAVFGTGQGRRWFFVGFTFLAMAFALYVFAWRTDRRDLLAHVAIGLLIAGGLGNLYDRLVYACVRDFLHPLPTAMMPFGLRWPSGDRALWPYVSNVADAFLIVGIAVLVIKLWGRGEPAEPAGVPKAVSGTRDDSAGAGS